ncbi:cysteine synthase A [Haliangium ochraceum]|uniref:Cysteine synthase n=1 Tax=Haliangium ochraceum (strain DSM 14365 / JCM 11303 / SMP-2) TaxID=502025 RepID=D0LKV3_HALO1|nr:cysteine synthase A [Haliangium ochraceum]ACY16673.1 cysteine synthase [Haliangium ochraceum DSM 14365]
MTANTKLPPSGPPDLLRNVGSLVELIGNTPLVRLERVVESDAAEVWAKCEQYNPGGSVKDRIALAMITAAEDSGRITPGRSVIVEPTSGNTGIGLALVCAARGYRLILTMPESMSLERRALLESYGAEIVLTPEDQVMEGAVSKARELCADSDDHYMPDQFRNPANPNAHRTSTADEILRQMEGRSIDAFVSAIGTGGTVTGVGSILREHNPACAVIGIEPARSAVISGEPAGPHKIQGIGAGFVPEVLDREVLTELRTVEDREAYDMSKRLAREEGLLVGISAGANVLVAAQVARELGPGKRVVTVLCDTGERYFSLDEYFQ